MELSFGSQRIERIQVTPELAAEFLAQNRHNRTLSRTTVETYASCMSRGEWHDVVNPIRFDRDGCLLDGQHRLAALILAGTTLTMWVAFGEDPGSFKYIDRGKKRNWGDLMSIAGEANYRMVGGASRMMAIWLRTGRIVQSGHDGVSEDEVFEALRDHPSIREGARFMAGHKTARQLVGSNVGAFLYSLFSDIDEEQALQFFESIETGEGLQKGNPVLALRERLIQLRARPDSYAGSAAVAAFTIKAWNAFRLGRRLFLLKWARSGNNAEEFPIPV